MIGLAICLTIAISAAIGAVLGYGLRVCEVAFWRKRSEQLAKRLDMIEGARGSWTA